MAVLAAIVTSGFIIAEWAMYQASQKRAAQAYRFDAVEVGLTQPPFNGIATQIDGKKWVATGPEDIVTNPEPISLYDTITLALRPLATGSVCASSNIDSYEVVVDAPGFTVDKIGDASRSRQMLLAPECDLSLRAPPAAPAWRWNLMATQPGNHVITLVLQALDKAQHVVDSREVDIPVIVPPAPESFSSYIGLLGVLVSITSLAIGLWERFRKVPPATASVQ